MRIRLLISVLLVALYGVFCTLYTHEVRRLVQAQLAPLQVGNDAVQYGLSRMMNVADFVSAFVTLLLVAGLIFIWLTYYLDQRQPASINYIHVGNQ